MMAFRKIFVQDEQSLQLLKQNDFTNAELAGDTRFDRVWEIALAPKQIPLIANFKGEKKLLVAGSTWPPDEKLILQLTKELDDEWKLVIVPHEIDSSHLLRLRKEANMPVLFYSEVEAGKETSNEKVLVVDKIGMLSSIYQYANLAYIGGGFGEGIHNTPEAAVFGVPVLIRTKFSKVQRSKITD
jgi:3-deoxy-D-manno-octulosonic-acid transferase